ncbi:malic enzyme [Absidia repens]|uniref:Malic enzyme n=1 Tax=Absidia repens TaxID=90262 RepID=A0A1X2J1M3_9FUNG|nr:malic enzyme [Absidia repens]
MFMKQASHSYRTLARQSNTHRRRWYAQPSSLLQETPQSATSASAGKPVKLPKSVAARSSYYNQGTMLTPLARQELGLQGLSPPAVESLDMQKTRALSLLRSKSSSLEKYIFLGQLRNSNSRLFYKLVNDQFEEIAPIIYTPTVGEACMEYSNIYPFLAPPGAPDGLYITINDLPNLEEIIRNYCEKAGRETPEITVISDGSRILGLGDLGVNGIGIPIGKLQLYVGAAGIDPRKTLPIILDFGTNNEKYLNDPLYLGLKQKRPDDKKFYDSMEKVMNALYSAFPDILVQFEDFQSDRAFGLLEKYQNNRLCFNDDIQGTGSVILAGFINALRLAQDKANVNPKDHRIVFFGAGSSAIGVGKQIQAYFIRRYNMSEQDAKNIFYYVDSKGLVTNDRGDKLAQHKVYFARDDNQQKQFKTLSQVIDYAQPTVLIGLSGQGKAFTNTTLQKMGDINKCPIVFPLSNPMTNAECTFDQAMYNTDERVIFASGTAFPPYTSSSGKVVTAGQGNNMYIFPGLGLGTLVAKSKLVSDGMIFAASEGLAGTLSLDDLEQGAIYPSLARIREVSTKVAAAVCRQALAENLATNPALLELSNNHQQSSSSALDQSILEYVESTMWDANEDENFIVSI